MLPNCCTEIQRAHSFHVYRTTEVVSCIFVPPQITSTLGEFLIWTLAAQNLPAISPANGC